MRPRPMIEFVFITLFLFQHGCRSVVDNTSDFEDLNTGTDTTSNTSADSDADSGIETDPHTGPDSDIDTTTDSPTDENSVFCIPGEMQECLCTAYLEGMQICKDDGSGWGPCDCGSGDVDTDTDTDIDTDTDTDIVTDTDSDTDLDPKCDPTYQYSATCVGDDSADGCCSGAVSNEPVFRFGSPRYPTGVETNIRYYCYARPTTILDAGITPCECGDQPVEFELVFDAGTDVWEACLPIGSQQTTTPVVSKILSREQMDSISQEDITMVDIPTRFDGVNVPLKKAFGGTDTVALDKDGLENDDVIVLSAQGQVGSAVWMLLITIPEERWVVGTLVSPYTEPTNGKEDIRFRAVLYYITVAGSSVDKVWLEGWATDGTLTIHNTGDICGEGECPNWAEYSLDLDYVGLKSEIDSSE